MPDTPRTLAELLTIYADNTVRAISPQDGRDFIVSSLIKKEIGAYVIDGQTYAKTAAGIQAAIDAAGAAGGGNIFLPPETININASLDFSNYWNVHLWGVGAGILTYIGEQGTKLLWTGSADGVMIRIEADTNGDDPSGRCGVHNLTLDGDNSAGIGISLISAFFAEIYDVGILDCKEWGIKTNVHSAALNHARNTEECHFRNIQIRTAGTTNGGGIFLTGAADGVADTHNCVFDNLYIEHMGTGNGIKIGVVDSNHFRRVICIRSSGSAAGVLIDTTVFGGGNSFVHLDPGPGGYVQTDMGPGSNGGPNVILNYVQANGAPAPSVSDGELCVFPRDTDFRHTVSVPVQMFTIAQGTPALALVGDNGEAWEKPAAWAFDGAGFEAITTTVVLGEDWDAGEIDITLDWAPASGAGGNVLWHILAASIEIDTQIDQDVQHSISGLSAAGTTAEAHKTITLSFTPTDRVVRLGISRQGGDSTDTLNSVDAWLFGVSYTYDRKQYT